MGCYEPIIDEPIIGESTIDELIIYSINDFHGALLEDGDKVGISKLGNYLINEKEKIRNLQSLFLLVISFKEQQYHQ